MSKGRGKNFNPNGFFPTPHEVVECMSQMAFSGADQHLAKFQTVNDCCVGTGRMLLHASNHSLRLSGADIDGLVLEICKINLALYAPWGAFPFPESFFGDRR
jgi:type I restriction-modification system DNA methylase subunit